jgi:two-component system phosphate regulon response regulator PhoB
VPKSRILLVDDDPGLRKLVGTTLGSDDFELLNAEDGEQALVLAHSEQPDIILLDINMPKKDGLQVCRELKCDPRTASIKVVMLTASGADVDRQSAEAALADDYFVKPFSPVALLNKVYGLLERGKR